MKEKSTKIKITKKAFINGKYVNAIDNGTIKKVSPIDGRDLSGLSSCKQEDVDYAVSIAKKTFESKIWVDTPLKEKKLILLCLADLMEKHREEIALLDTIETGRAYKNYYYDSIPKAIEVLRYFAESADKYYDHAIPSRIDASATISREPLGVIALITPWNDPMVVSIWKLAPALLMGNSVIIKPAEQSSFSIILIARLAQEAGIPDGIFNVVTGYGEVAGRALALHNDVAGVFFTGSSEVGKKILQYSGQSNMKKVGLECGGKSPFIVSKKFNDLPKAAKVLAKNIFYNQGQICSAPSRAIIDNTIKDRFIELLKSELEKYIPHDPFNINSEVGCVVSNEQKKKIQCFIQHGIEQGAEIYTGIDSGTMDPKSSYILPTIFVQDNNKTTIAQEEIFGPVLLIIGTDTIQESISTANDTKFGLAASIWSNDLDESHWASRALHAGIVHINSYGDDDNSVPFGGVKESGIGKDKSMYAFDEYSYLKTTWIHYEPIK